MYANQSIIRFVSGVTMAIGAWIALTPLFLDVSGTPMWAQLIAGAILFVAGGAQMLTHSQIPSWVNGLTALALIVLPLFYTLTLGMFWNDMIAGFAVLLLSAYDGYEVTHDKQIAPAM